MKEYFEIYIKTETEILYPAVLDGVKVEMTEMGAPSKLTFQIAMTENMGIDYGNKVTLNIKGKLFFMGYIFKMKPQKDEILELMCYDSLRYLKNKGSYVFKNESYSDMLKKIASDFKLPIGEVEDTGFKLKGRVEAEKEFWEILMNASNETTNNTGNIYVLFDKGNSICLKKRENMKVDTCVVTKDTFQDYEYEGTIDENTYNSVFITQLDDNQKEVATHKIADQNNVNKWGVLQYYALTTEKETSIKEKMAKILQLTNKPTRKFKALDVFGDANVRAGSVVPVLFNLYDLSINGYMVVGSVTHKFESDGIHFMDMSLYNFDIMPQVQVDGIFDNEQSKNNASKNGGKGSYTSAPTEKANDFINTVIAKEGRPYVWAADGKNDTYDCSGLVSYGLREMGVLGSGQRVTTESIPKSPLFEKIPVSQAQPGDLVWRRSGNSGHVAVVVGDNKTFEAKSKNSGIGYGTIDNKYMSAYRVKEFYS